MSPHKFSAAAPAAVESRLAALWTGIGIQVRDARLAKRWSLSELARRAGMSRATAYELESGKPTSLEALVRIANALGLRLDLALTDPRKREARANLGADVVSSAMGEFEAGHLRAVGHPVGLDEPYQHFQFAGRADLVAWNLDAAALLHIENRTRFPDFQEMAGAYNAKRAYLGDALASRLGVRRWRTETHAIAALWSAEVLHALRQRAESFRSLCPDGTEAFEAWWSGPPPSQGKSSTLIVLDPLAAGRQRPFVGLQDAISATRPRHKGYADAAAKLPTTGE